MKFVTPASLFPGYQITVILQPSKFVHKMFLQDLAFLLFVGENRVLCEILMTE